MRCFESVQGVIFDLDGVLLDTEVLYTEATNEVLAPFGQRLTRELKSQIMGREPRWGAERVLTVLRIPWEPVPYLEALDAALTRRFVDAQAVRGAAQWVAELRTARVPLAVGTSSSRGRFELKTTHHGWLREFDKVVCGDDPRVGARKPEPDIFLVAAAELGLEPAKCVVFEDSPAGIAAARAAGMPVVALCSTELASNTLVDADLVVEGYGELRLSMFGFSAREQ